MNENPNWLDAQDWKWVQSTLPIACCDVVPVMSDGGTIQKVGLIYRDTPHQGKRWCIVGGRMYHNESMDEAASRQLFETLGPDIQFQITSEMQPHFVAQYFTAKRPLGFVDPRQHALTMVFVVPITGTILAMGEANSFKWFDPDKLPPADKWGFGQDEIARQALARWQPNSSV